jgi:hypothetical protein
MDMDGIRIDKVLAAIIASEGDDVGASLERLTEED